MDLLAEIAAWANANEGLITLLAGMGTLIAFAVRQRRLAAAAKAARAPVPADLLVRPARAEHGEVCSRLLADRGGRDTSSADVLVYSFSDADEAARSALALAAAEPEIFAEAEVVIVEHGAPTPDEGAVAGRVVATGAIRRALLDARDLEVTSGGTGRFPFVVRVAGPLRAWRRGALPAAGAALVLAGAALWLAQDRRETPIRSLAVLPFDNLSGDPAQEYFADGMTESIIGELARIETLRVISRRSIVRFKGTEEPLREVGELLGAEFIVEGSVHREADAVAVHARLIDARTDAHLWADQFSRPHRDILSLQHEIARAVGDAVHGTLSETVGKRRAVNPDAHNLYWQGRALLDEGNVNSALAKFREATQIDPEFALGYAGIAAVYDWMMTITLISPREGIPRLRNATLRAHELDPDSSETLYNRAHLDFFEWRLSDAETGYRRAIERNPSLARAYFFLGHVLAITDRCGEAVRTTRVGFELDPLSALSVESLGGALAACGAQDEAVELLEAFLDRDPTSPVGRTVLAGTLGRDGDAAGSLREATRLAENYPDAPAAIAQVAWAHAIGGERERAQRRLEDAFEASRDRYLAPVAVARVYSALRVRRETLEWLRKAVEQRDWLLLRLRLDGDFRWLETDPEFEDIVAEVGVGRS